MLLQTNSYIVPKDRRAEHARLIRRFRHALARIGCDQFEVYEQVGANWSPGGANGRYVQIMRFRDRQHQQAVQAAEAKDHGAQQIIAEFCDLINFPYQQEHGYFATGFYTSVLPTGPRQAIEHDNVDTDSVDTEDATSEHTSSAAPGPFADGAAVHDMGATGGADEFGPGAESASEYVQDVDEKADDGQALHESVAEAEHDVDLDQAESDALAEHAVVDNEKTSSSLGSFLDSLNDADLHTDIADTGHGVRFNEPHLGSPEAGFADVPISAQPAARLTGDDAAQIAPDAPSHGTLQEHAHADNVPVADPERDVALFDTPQIDTPHGAHATELPPGELDFEETLSEFEPPSDPAATEVSAATEDDDLGLLFEEELPDDNMPFSESAATVGHDFNLGEDAPPAVTHHEPPSLAAPTDDDLAGTSVHGEPHEELLPAIPESYDTPRGPGHLDSASPDEGGLDALLDDANLLDHVPFPGTSDEAPRVHARPDSEGGNGHAAPHDKDTDLLEFESLIRQLEEDPSPDHGHLTS